MSGELYDFVVKVSIIAAYDNCKFNIFINSNLRNKNTDGLSYNDIDFPYNSLRSAALSLTGVKCVFSLLTKASYVGVSPKLGDAALANQILASALRLI